jgi:hypothetical protein
MTPEAGFAALVDFYRDVRTTDCETRPEADMLLVQWGVYDWGKREHFSFNVTRQFVLVEGEDEDIFQLGLTFNFLPTANLRSFGRGNRWCESRRELPS